MLSSFTEIFYSFTFDTFYLKCLCVLVYAFMYVWPVIFCPGLILHVDLMVLNLMRTVDRMKLAEQRYCCIGVSLEGTVILFPPRYIVLVEGQGWK